jgi:hypothetical protein
MGRGLVLVFSTRDFFGSDSRIGHISSPRALMKDDSVITDFLLCSPGLSVLLGVLVKMVWIASPLEGWLAAFTSVDKVSSQEGPALLLRGSFLPSPSFPFWFTLACVSTCLFNG